MERSLYQVDAFTSEPFAGNPAAVCPMDAPADEAWMAQVAAEMNLSETAFVHPEGDGFRLRWFTPTGEVRLCGHATLATAHVLWETGAVSGDQIRFHTRSGSLAARRTGGGIEIDLPALPPEPCAPPEGLSTALGVTPIFCTPTASPV